MKGISCNQGGGGSICKDREAREHMTHSTNIYYESIVRQDLHYASDEYNVTDIVELHTGATTSLLSNKKFNKDFYMTFEQSLKNF